MVNISTIERQIESVGDALREIRDAVEDAQTAFSRITELARNMDADNWEESSNKIFDIANAHC